MKIEIISPNTKKKLLVAEDFFGPLNFEDALEACEALGIGWRIPSKDELCEIYEQFGKRYTNSVKKNFLWCSSVCEVVDEIKLELIRSGIYSAGPRNLRPSNGKKPSREYRVILNFTDGSFQDERICNNCLVLAVFDLDFANKLQIKI